MGKIEDKIVHINEKKSNIEDLVSKLENNIGEVRLKYINYIKECNEDKVAVRIREESNFFLIGATGYLGTYLLNELLANTNCNLVVLIHNTSVNSMKNKLKITGDMKKTCQERIKFVHGDVEKRHLGMTDENYEYVKNNINVIVNLAVNKSVNGDYFNFEKINVKSLDYVFELMNHTKSSVDLYHISTIGVSEGRDNNKEYSFFSENTIDYERSFEHIELNHNYYLTKYEAEKAVLNYANRSNNKVHILRIGNIAFPYCMSAKHEVPATSFGILISSMLKIGIMPDDEEKVLEFTFVDDAAKAISHIINLEIISEETIDVYHIFNNEYYSFSELADMFSRYVPIKKMKYTDLYKYFDDIYQESDAEDRACIDYIVEKYLCERGMHTTKTIVVNDKTIKFLKQQKFQWHKLQDIEMKSFIEEMLNRKVSIE